MRTIHKTLMLVATMAVATASASYAQEAADTVVNVPQSGYLPVKPSRPFSGPANLLIVNTNASNNAKTTDITYYKYRADTVVAMASCYILVGQPGTYTLTFQETATLKGTSNSGWYDGTGKYTDTRKNRCLYKFVADGERVGFQRDETYAAENYQSCDFAEGEHFYISTTSAIADKIAAASGKTDHSDLDFIVWHGPTPDDASTGILYITSESPQMDDGAVYNLQGCKVAESATPDLALPRGIYIKNGKKYIIK